MSNSEKFSTARAKRLKAIEQEVREFFQIEGRYITMLRVCRALGYPRSTLTSMGFHTDTIALEFGYERPGKKPKGLKEENDKVEERFKHEYKEAIRAKGRPLTLDQFAISRNESATKYYPYGWDVQTLHSECGVIWHANKKMCSVEDAISTLHDMIQEKKRYVPRDELAEKLGVSGSLISIHEIDVAQINLEYGFRATYREFEIFIGKVLAERFPGFTFVTQKTFDGCQLGADGRSKLKYDYYCDELNLLVEADGGSHYQKTHMWYSEDVVKRDAFKTKWAEDNGIQLVRIPGTVGYSKVKALSYLSGISSPEKDGQPAAKPDEGQEGSTTSRKT